MEFGGDGGWGDGSYEVMNVGGDECWSDGG